MIKCQSLWQSARQYLEKVRLWTSWMWLKQMPFTVQMANLDLNDANEKNLVDGVFWNSTDSLSDDDKKLPQGCHILLLLTRGIGVHHSCPLPSLKEVIKIVF